MSEPRFVCDHEDRSGFHSGHSGLMSTLIFAGAPSDILEKVEGYVALIEQDVAACLADPDRARPDPPYPKP